MTEFDPTERSPDERAALLSAAVSPRPIAWISTTSHDDVDNLAPFSAYTHVSASPPILAVAITEREDGEPKDTVRNALVTEEFAVSVVTESLLESADATAAALSPTESEFDAAGVAREACVRIDAPRVAHAAVTMECTVHDSMAIGDRTLLFGRVVYVHAVDEVLTDGRLDVERLKAVGHVGRTDYARTALLEPPT